MKITTKQLGKVILEELDKVLSEQSASPADPGAQRHEQKMRESNQVFSNILKLYVEYYSTIEEFKKAVWKPRYRHGAGDPETGDVKSATVIGWTKDRSPKSERRARLLKSKIERSIPAQIRLANQKWNEYSTSYVDRGRELIIKMAKENPPAEYAAKPTGESTKIIGLADLESHALNVPSDEYTGPEGDRQRVAGTSLAQPTMPYKKTVAPAGGTPDDRVARKR
jgi:hypothetical protein